MDAYIQFLMPLFIAVVSSVVTVQLSIRQFRSQGWWERKAEAYAHIFEQLTRVHYSINEWLGDAEGSIKITDEANQKLRRDYWEGTENISKAAAAGAFIISEEASEALEKLIHEISTSNDDYDYHSELSANREAINQCIKKMRNFAQKDLKL